MKLNWRLRSFILLLKKELSSLSSTDSKDSTDSISSIVSIYSLDSDSADLLTKLLGHLLSEIEQNQQQAVSQLKDLINEKQSILAEGILGVCLLFGLGTDQDPEKAIKHLKSAKKCTSFAYYFLGRAKELAIGGSKNLVKAKRYYEKTANEHNYPLANFELAAFIVQEPKSSEQDFKIALDLYKKVKSSIKMPEIDLSIGWLYQYCLQSQNHLEMAIKYYQLAANANNPCALFNLGVMYSEGFGVAQDKKKSAEYLMQASALGVLEAHYNLAVKYIMGEGVKKDQIQGFKLTKKAAKAGFVPAKYKLALLYQLGIGVDANKAKADKWLLIAANEGNENAQADLAANAQEELAADEQIELAANAQVEPVADAQVELVSNAQEKHAAVEDTVSLSVVSMAPINSSGDIYHILSYIMERKANQLPIQDIVLCYDTESKLSGSKTDTKAQVERALNFAMALNLHEYFRNPFIERIIQSHLRPMAIVNIIKEYLGDVEARTLHLEKGDSSQPNPRQAKLEAFFAQEAKHGLEIEYTDQRALTTKLCNAFRRDRQNTISILEGGYRSRNPKIISEAEQTLLKDYAQYWKKQIIESRSENQPLIILHLRHSSTANSDQDAADGFLVRLIKYLKTKGYLIWFIFADSRMNKSFVGIKNNRISPFNKPLKKYKEHYETLMLFEKKLQAQRKFQTQRTTQTQKGLQPIPDYDFGKLKHLELLLALRQLDFLKGIVGNTSGTLDVAAFMGHHVYNIHHFSEKITYQDYRMLMGLSFLSIENYVEPKVKKAGRKAIRDKELTVTHYIQNFDQWLISEDGTFIAPSIAFKEPNFESAGFNTLIFTKVFKHSREAENIILPGARKVQKYINNIFK